MRMYDIICDKRNGKALSGEQIEFFIQNFVGGEIPDYQAAALCMAICFQGMTAEETAILTDAMARSGDMLDLSRFGTLSADKHSTGGVGDKTTLIVAPIVASLGGKVAKMSGRGLGYTGGTVDKLESIPGYRTDLSVQEFLDQVERVGIAIVGQSGDLTPADKKLYALRDVTATVDSIPLITSSIMCKKLAAGAHSIVLDVKCGSGAFAKTREAADVLAENMVRIGKACGRKTAALITNMDVPLGNAVGNALEVEEAVRVLRGEVGGPLKEICVALAAQMIALIFDRDIATAHTQVEKVLASGAAYQKMKEWITAQGGDVRYIDDPDLFEKAPCTFEVTSESDGYIAAIGAEQIGLAAVTLGAGRNVKDDRIDHAAGVMLHKTVGDRIQAGESLCTIYTAKAEVARPASRQILSAVTVSKHPAAPHPLIYRTVV